MRRQPELCGFGRVEVLPGARRRRRHESSPHTRTRPRVVVSLRLVRSPSTFTAASVVGRSHHNPHHVRHVKAAFRLQTPPPASSAAGPLSPQLWQPSPCPPTAAYTQHLENQGST